MKLKKLIAGFLCSALLLTNVMPAAACTGIYIGDEVSENGSTYMGRCEDMGYDYVKIFGVSEAKDYPADYVYKDAYGFSMPYGGHVYRYTYIKDSAKQGETLDDFEAYAEAGQNEKGVSVSATVSTYGGEAAEKADPLNKTTGLCEVSITTLLLGKAATAKEAVDLLANIVDTYGAGECNQITISDPKETWYFEIVSGHQYGAVKLPANKVVINPNIMMLGVIDVNDKENVVASKNLVSTAKDNGFLVTDDSGKIDVAKTYSNKNSGSGQYVRYLQGLFYINKAEAEKLKVDFKTVDNNSKTDAVVSLLHDADKKMSTMDIFHLLSTRGEGTPYDQNEGKATYSIGNENQAECHVFEIRDNMPLGLTTIQWQALCPSEYSIYIPYYSALVTSVLGQYNAENTSYVDNSMFWTFAEIYRMCSADRTNVGAAVKAYFEDYQESLVKQQKAVDTAMKQINDKNPKKLSEAATNLGLELAKQVYSVASQVKNELEAYVAAGDTSKPFALSSKVTGTMPKYESLAKKYVNQNTADGVKATKITKLTAKASKDSVKLTWKKSGSYAVDTYRVYRATTKNGKYKLVKEVKGTTTSLNLSTKKLKSGKTYYYKVRGVKTVDGKKVYTNYSSKVSAKVK